MSNSRSTKPETMIEEYRKKYMVLKGIKRMNMNIQIDFESHEELDNVVRVFAYAIMLSRRPERYIRDSFEDAETLIRKQEAMTQIGDYIVMFIRGIMFRLQAGIDITTQERDKDIEGIKRAIADINKHMEELDELRGKCIKRTER